MYLATTTPIALKKSKTKAIVSTHVTKRIGQTIPCVSFILLFGSDERSKQIITIIDGGIKYCRHNIRFDCGKGSTNKQTLTQKRVVIKISKQHHI